jgi:hypothetical protein
LRDADGRPDPDKIRRKFDRISRGPDGTPVYFTKENVTGLGFQSYDERRMRIYEELELMYTKGQVKFLNFKILKNLTI